MVWWHHKIIDSRNIGCLHKIYPPTFAFWFVALWICLDYGRRSCIIHDHQFLSDVILFIVNWLAMIFRTVPIPKCPLPVMSFILYFLICTFIIEMPQISGWFVVNSPIILIFKFLRGCQILSVETHFFIFLLEYWFVLRVGFPWTQKQVNVFFILIFASFIVFTDPKVFLCF